MTMSRIFRLLNVLLVNCLFMLCHFLYRGSSLSFLLSSASRDDHRRHRSLFHIRFVRFFSRTVECFPLESFPLPSSRVTGGELFEDIVAREYYSEADAR